MKDNPVKFLVKRNTKHRSIVPYPIDTDVQLGFERVFARRGKVKGDDVCIIIVLEKIPIDGEQVLITAKNNIERGKLSLTCCCRLGKKRFESVSIFQCSQWLQTKELYITHSKRIKVQEIHRREVALQLVEMNMQKKLSALAVGQKAIISSLEDEELVLKLMEMGFLPGEEITVEQIAPLGDPISVMVAGYQVSLRISEADAVMVEVK